MKMLESRAVVSSSSVVPDPPVRELLELTIIEEDSRAQYLFHLEDRPGASYSGVEVDCGRAGTGGLPDVGSKRLCGNLASGLVIGW